MEAPQGRSRSIGLPPQPTPASRTFFCSCFPFTRSVARSSSMSVALGRASTPRALIQLRSCQPAPTVDIRTSRFAQSPPGDACPQDGQRPQSRDGVSAKHGGYPGVRPRDSRASSPTRGSRTTRSRGGRLTIGQPTKRRWRGRGLSANRRGVRHTRIQEHLRDAPRRLLSTS